jgi:acetyl esterase/lipase
MATTTTVLHSYPHLTANSTFAQVIDDPAFAPFGVYMAPAEDPGTVKALRVAPISILHTAVPELVTWDPQTIANGLNFVIDEVNAGVNVWHPLYSAKDIAADPTKKAAGMWFFPGEAGKPLAVVAAGGGFRAVSSLQEAFPLAQKLHEMGYNVAVLKYRVSGQANQGQTNQAQASQSTSTTQPNQPQVEQAQEKAIEKTNEDMAAAMTILKDNASAWHVSFDNYSVWGSSAGGQLMSAWGADGSTGAKAHGFPKPAVVVAAYTPPRGFKITKAFPPSFVTVGAKDTTAGVAPVESMVNQLKAAGVPVEFELYPNVGHGFGLGTGTPAAGWYQKAVAFWQAHMSS